MRGDHGEAFKVAVDFGKAADEARFLHLHLFQDLLHDLRDVPDGLGNVLLARVHPFIAELVELEKQLALSSHHSGGLAMSSAESFFQEFLRIQLLILSLCLNQFVTFM